MAPHVNRRMPVSCEPCRSRKIRCSPSGNSQGSCASCVRRGLPRSQCVYVRSMLGHESAASQQITLSNHSNSASNEELLDRIRALEDLVRGQSRSDCVDTEVQGTGHPTPISPVTQASTAYSAVSTNQPTQPAAGVLRFSHGGYQRFEPYGSQWSSILDPSSAQVAIGGLEDSAENSAAGFPFDLNPGLQLENILAQLPPRTQCDELKNTYMNVFAPLFHVLHDPTFEAQYAQFQHDPESVSMSWLALLFSILSIAVMACNDSTGLLFDLSRKNSTPESITFLSSRYRGLAMQCLQADQFLWRHTLCTLQTLILLIYGINHTHGRTWALLGSTYNIAIALGCHVDPDAFQLTQVEQEERRRCWAAVIMLFTIQNTSMGYLDHRVITHNVKLPMDANDIDIEDGFALLSGTHPPTQMSYILHKFRLYGICTKICQGVFGQTTPSYDSILALEREIHHEKTGWEARYASEDQSYTLPPYHKVHLSILDAYSHQLMLLLHRPVLIRALDNADFGPAEFNNSRNRCIDSAERLLHIQETFFKSTEFVSFRWYNEGLSSFHAFHAFIVLFVLLNSMTDATEYFELKQLLKRSLSIFEAMAGRSRVCAKAGPVLRYLLSTTPELPITQPRFGDQLGTRQNVSMDAISRSLEPFQWLSPSNMSWEDWNIILGSS